MQTDDILRRHSLYQEAPRSVQEEMARSASPARLDRSTYYFRTGDPCRGIALLGRGSVRVFKTGKTGREITLYHVAPGESCLLTMNGALTGEPYPADCLVEEDVEALVLPVAPFNKWVNQVSAVRRIVFGVMTRRIHDLMSLVDEVAFERMDHRLAEFLLGAFGGAAGAHSVIETTHDQIAGELGTAREVISRLLKEFEREGILRLGRSKLELINRELLKARGGQD